MGPMTQLAAESLQRKWLHVSVWYVLQIVRCFANRIDQGSTPGLSQYVHIRYA